MAEQKHSELFEAINPLAVKTEYAVRGEIVIRANNYQKQLESGDHSLPFSEIVSCNIGNPHALGQQPISFLRQVTALVGCPDLISGCERTRLVPQDVIERAKHYVKNIPGGTGAYTHSQGLDIIRQDVAKFIAERDGYPCNKDDLYLTDGASPAIKLLLSLLIRNEKDCIMIPIPQYPLYSASIVLFGGSKQGYYLDESHNWELSIKELERSIAEARQRGEQVRSLVVINPGNPVGAVLSLDVQKDIIRFCHREHIVLLADEVYQENIYQKERPFHSFKKVLMMMEDEIRNSVVLGSFHSISKGFIGECGRRGGYMELVNWPKDVREIIYKLSSINLCANVEGQLLVGLMCQPPKKGDPSYTVYAAEKETILFSMQKRAKLISTALNELEGISCNPIDGAMYAYPSLTLPQKAIEAAKAAGKQPDVFYCIQLLDETGLVVVPGSGFGQYPGTYHFRTTMLPPEDKIGAVLLKLKEFHKKFMNTYRS